MTLDTHLLLDVRTPGEFAAAHVPGSVNVPLHDLRGALDEVRETARERPILVVCRTGRRAEDACAQLAQAGLETARAMPGGIVAWEREGGPVNRAKGGMSLERQVRILAGALVFSGTALGFFLHTGFLALPAFVGAGLVFAGVSDTCAMGMLLARLPFNRRAASC